MHDTGRTCPINIRYLEPGEIPPYHLLLDADPRRSSVDAYLKTSVCRVAVCSGTTAGICVTTALSPDTWEILNLAVDEGYRRKGIARALIADAESLAAAAKAVCMEIGTGNSGFSQLRLYQSCGYRMTGIVPDYFTTHCDEPIFEDGIPCIDMVRLAKDLCV